VTGELFELPAVPPWPVVLYFHHVGRAYEHYTSIGTDEFQEALDVIHHVGYLANPLSMAPAMDDEVPFLLTFDDGFQETFENVQGPLHDRGANGVLFINTAHAGKAIRHAHQRGHLGLRWRELASAASSGWAIGSHGHTHRNWQELTASEVRREARLSARLIIDKLQLPVWGLAYPYGCVPTFADGLGSDVRRFATTRVPASPWDKGHPIRRVYLPKGRQSEWPAVVRSWRERYVRESERLRHHCDRRPSAGTSGDDPRVDDRSIASLA
jgi:peptidoglycan/xylan/chitin deacetylase (PgdA/CDA1 family)